MKKINLFYCLFFMVFTFSCKYSGTKQEQDGKAPVSLAAAIEPFDSGGDVSIQVNGTVTDEEGFRIPGVSVVIKGTSHGTVTNLDGAYILLVDNVDEVLVFSLVGYRTQEIRVGNRTIINVTMESDI